MHRGPARPGLFFFPPIVLVLESIFENENHPGVSRLESQRRSLRNARRRTERGASLRAPLFFLPVALVFFENNSIRCGELFGGVPILNQIDSPWLCDTTSASPAK